MSDELTFPFNTKVAGVTFKSDDGKERQWIIREYCKPGQSIYLLQEKNNPEDPDAIAIYVKIVMFIFLKDYYKIGCLYSSHTSKFNPLMDKGMRFTGKIRHITGGTGEKKTLGVNIEFIPVAP